LPCETSDQSFYLPGYLHDIHSLQQQAAEKPREVMDMNNISRIRRRVLAGAVLVLLVLAASAHAPLLPGENQDPGTATAIGDPAKSWAIYSEITDGEVHYYRFPIEQGERIYLSLFIPADEDRTSLPGFVLMGPGLPAEENIPGSVQSPEGAGAVVVSGEGPAEAEYEPFSPSTFYEVAELDIAAPETGTYTIAVFHPHGHGRYGLALGYREEFTPGEFLLIPITLLPIYVWGGQSLALVLLPLIGLLVAGLLWMAVRSRAQKSPGTLLEWSAGIAGLVMLGSGAIRLYQMALAVGQASSVPPSATVTLILGLIPVVLGIALLRVALSDGRDVGTGKRLLLVFLGLLGLLTWSGLIIGPILAIVAGILPSKRNAPRSA
jgi:hypothetical protein